MKLTNETGTFTIDDNGVLLRYESTFQNMDCPDKSPKNIVRLTIPEGVRELPDDAFRGYRIFVNLELPASLKRLGENAFLGAHISPVDGLRLPDDPDLEMMRQLAHRLRFVHTWNADSIMKGWPQECKDIYMGRHEPRESWQLICNDSGAFWIDSDGVLMNFNPDSWFRPGNSRQIIEALNIPEGVKAIPCGMFKEYVIHGTMTLPKSLLCIGVGYSEREEGNAFRHSWLPDLVLPETLEALGTYAFASTVIRSVTALFDPEKILPERARQFMGAKIGELRVPVKYRDLIQEYPWKDGHEMDDPVYGRLYCVRHQYGNEVMAFIDAVQQLREV